MTDRPTLERAVEALTIVAYGYENTRPTERSALMMVKLSNVGDQYPELAVPLVRLSDAQAALRALMAGTVEPTGWKLVPLEPTEAMIEAWAIAPIPPALPFETSDEANRVVATADWQAMLAASPDIGKGGELPVQGDAETFVRDLLWNEQAECCRDFVVGASYMGSNEVLCCGNPDYTLLDSWQIVASLRAKFPEVVGQADEGSGKT